VAIPVRIVDAFTSDPFAGNPAGVCLLAGPIEERLMQDVAAELAVGATAFAWPQDGGFALRWFTPVREIELCGHGTLAAAHSLWETGSQRLEILFLTRAGELRCSREGDAVRMDFPAEAAAPCAAPGSSHRAWGPGGRRDRLGTLLPRAILVGRDRPRPPGRLPGVAAGRVRRRRDAWRARVDPRR
jgi:predicted PhzF superfamily epimerase YddE/YHI9